MIYKRKSVATKRLVLRPLIVSDYAVWAEALANRKPVLNRWDLGPLERRLCTRAWFLKIKNRYQALANKDDYYWYGIFEKKTGAMIGHIDIDVFVRSTHQFANFGYQIYNRHWGHGYGQEAAAAGLRIGFSQLKLNRLEAAINLDNKKSKRLALAIGMRKEGIKKRYWFEQGKWVDHLIYVANPEDLGMNSDRPF